MSQASRPPAPNLGGVGTDRPPPFPAPPELGAGGAIGQGASWERITVAALIAATLLLTSLSYMIGYAGTPPGTRFIGTAYNIDDFCNYLSWLRQNADGYFFYHNLFTTDPQKNLEFNVFFYLLGRLMHYAHLPPQAVWQIARVGGGAALLGLIWRIYRHCLPGDENRAARLTAFGFVCLSSGFGWVQWARWQDKSSSGSPIDAWQPEAYTFLSLDTSALFAVSTLLILATLYALLRGEETGRWRYPVLAGVCGAILGNMHSYDVLHLACAWGLFLVVWTVLRRGRGVGMSWLRGIVALALTVPTTLYQLYIFNAEATFHKRANVPTLSPAFWHYVLGYGIVFLLALVALVRLPQNWGRGGRTGDMSTPPRPLLFAVCWAVGGFAAAYLPFAFQRKMLMGEHIPLCLLAGVGASYLVRRWATRPQRQAATLALLVLATFPSNALFLRRDIRHLMSDHSETGLSPFLPNTLYDAYGWVRRNLSPRQDAVLGLPNHCAPLPGATDRVVWCGHWAETPSYGLKIEAIARFAEVAIPDYDSQLQNPVPPDVTLDLSNESEMRSFLYSDYGRRFSRLRFLQSIPATYLLYPNDVSRPYVDKQGRRHPFADFAHHPPPYLQPVYANPDYTIFRIVPGTAPSAPSDSPLRQ